LIWKLGLGGRGLDLRRRSGLGPARPRIDGVAVEPLEGLDAHAGVDEHVVDLGRTHHHRARLRERHRREQERSCQQLPSSPKFTSTVAATGPATPSFIPGWNRHWLTAAIAFSSSPSPRPWVTRILWAQPSGPTSIYSTTVP